MRYDKALEKGWPIATGMIEGACRFVIEDRFVFSSRDRVPGKAKRYTPEFKEQAARKVVDNSLPIAHVARELGVNDTTHGFWVKDYRKKLAGQPPPPDMPDQERIRELVRRNRELEMENAFLKKAAAYFAREHR
jgi:transposase-like protein